MALQEQIGDVPLDRCDFARDDGGASTQPLALGNSPIPLQVVGIAQNGLGNGGLARPALACARAVGHDAEMNVASSPRSDNWLDQIRPAMRNVAPSGIVEVFNYGRGRQGLIPLWVGEGDLPTPPFISEAAKASLDRGETFYTAQRGVPELRAAIAAYMTRIYGAAPGGGAFSPENFFVTIGGMHAIEIATRLIAGPGDEALIPSPAWPNFVGALEISGARAVPVPLDRARPLEPRSGEARQGGHPGDAPHFSQFPGQPDRLHRDARGNRRDARHRPPAWLVDHRRRNLRPHDLRWGPRPVFPRRNGARRQDPCSSRRCRRTGR